MNGNPLVPTIPSRLAVPMTPPAAPVPLLISLMNEDFGCPSRTTVGSMIPPLVAVPMTPPVAPLAPLFSLVDDALGAPSETIVGPLVGRAAGFVVGGICDTYISL